MLFCSRQGLSLNAIKVWLHPVLCRYVYGYDMTLSGEIHVDIPRGASVSELLSLIGIPQGSTEVVLVNGDLAGENTVLPEDGFVKVYPIFGGG